MLSSMFALFHIAKCRELPVPSNQLNNCTGSAPTNRRIYNTNQRTNQNYSNHRLAFFVFCSKMRAIYLLILIVCIVCIELGSVEGQTIFQRMDEVVCRRNCNRAFMSRSRKRGCCELYRACC
ncbi:hypothetical protein NPIL_159781 [Nephila pilipes]|uniref:Uncharacterized protein n=1 Tax=Nephila pilipes TaxID=299642 RepID=A0A8X6PWP0_NEPPI|nr:hypothetical protein NPIL_159781 [Nephila pilipes]